MIARLKVDSSEYDAKIQRAAKGIQHLAQQCHEAGGFLNVLEKENREYIQSLGRMETVSQTARGKVAELTAAFTDLKSMYNSLTADEKNSEFGRELDNQLDQLKTRIQDGKKEISDINKELSGGGGLTDALDAVAGKFGLNIKQLAGWGAAIGAAKVALDVAKDAFFKNEEQLDEWGRVVKSSESIYSGFLNALNNGDIGGFLNKINEIVDAARRAYDAVDELATYNAFNRMNVSNARADLSTAIADFRMGTGSKDAVKKANDALKAELKERQRLEREAYEESVRSMAIDRGANPDDVIRLLGGKYVDFKNVKKSYVGESSFTGSTVMPLFGGATVAGAMQGVNFTTQTRNTPGSDEERLSVFARSLNDTELDQLQAMGEQANNTKREIADLDKQLARVLNGRGGKSGSGSITIQEQTELQQNQKKINELTQQYVDLSKQGLTSDDERLVKLREEIKELEKRNGLLSKYAEQAHGRLLLKGSDIDLSAKGVNKTMFGDLGVTSKPKWLDKPAQIDDNGMKALTKQMEKQLKQDVKALKEQQKEEKTLNKIANKSKQFTTGLSEVSSGLQSLGLELPEGLSELIGVINGVSQIIQGVGTIISVFSTSAETANTIALDANTAALWANVGKPLANGGFAPGFAGGGMIPHAASGILMGNSYSGDNIGNVRLNAGELVLNKAQQGNLAAQLTGGGLQNLQIEAVVRGEQLLLVQNNRGRRTGKGEIVQSRRRR